MKLALGIGLSACALLADMALTASAIARPALSLAACLGLLFLRALVSALAAGAVQLDAPSSAARDRRSFFALAFALAFFVPVVGVVGVQLFARFGLTAKRAEAGDPWTTLDLDAELYDEPVAGKKPAVAASKIASILSQGGHEQAERRFQAILLVKHLPPNRQIPILKLALKDVSDEVRLFAFSRIEKFRGDLEAKIKEFTAELERGAAEGPQAQALLNLRLAESYHEIAYLQLAEGAVLTHALDRALAHALEAKRLSPASGPADYILGRVLLRKGDYDAAIAAFQAAVRLYYPRTKVIPYLAECAFRQKRYDAVRSMLGEMNRVTRGASAIQPVVDFWR